MSEPTDTTEPKAPKQPAAADPMAIIKVIKHRTRIGSHVKAIGHEETIPLSQAKALQAEGFIQIIGIR